VRFITGSENGVANTIHLHQKNFDLELICSAEELKAMANDRWVSGVRCNSEQDALSVQSEASVGDISGIQSKSALSVKLNHQESALSLKVDIGEDGDNFIFDSMEDSSSIKIKEDEYDEGSDSKWGWTGW
jgi:hypothetical protein